MESSWVHAVVWCVVLQDRKVVIIANLKPRNLKGIKSNGSEWAALLDGVLGTLAVADPTLQASLVWLAGPGHL
jgi:hypothetical protein